MQSAKVNEARGGAGSLIWDGTENYIITFLKLLAVFTFSYDTLYISDNPEGLWQSIASGRLVLASHMWSDTEYKCIMI